MFPAKVGALCDPKLRKVCLLHRNPDVCEHRQHLFAAARGNAAALLLQPNREKHVQVIKILKRRMAGIGALNDTDCPYRCAHRCMQLLRVAVIRAVRHRLTIVQRAEDLGQETLVVHIAARLVQALRRALLRAEEKVIPVEHSSCACRDAASVVFPAAQRPSMATSTRGCVAASARIRCRRTVSKSVIQSTCRQEDVLS